MQSVGTHPQLGLLDQLLGHLYADLEMFGRMY